MIPFLLVGILALAPDPPENPIAPYPAAALKSSTVLKNKMTTFDGRIGNRANLKNSRICCTINLAPNQSLMAMIQGANAGQFEVQFKDPMGNRIAAAPITRVGGKVFLINRNHKNFPNVTVVVEGANQLMEEPYNLFIAELDTDLALASETAPKS